MKGLSNKEMEILLLLVKDFSNDYNSNNITRKIDITSAGAFKAMKKLEKQNLILGRKMGRAMFYKANLNDDYTFKIAETLLINEAREKASRWIDEFNELYKHAEIVIVYGSIIKNKKSANDIDLLVLSKKEKNDVINKIIRGRRAISTRPIHLIKRTVEDLNKSLRGNDEINLGIIRSGVVLHGHDKLLEVVKNVSSI